MLEREPSPLTNMLVWLFAYMLQQATATQLGAGWMHILSSYQFRAFLSAEKILLHPSHLQPAGRAAGKVSAPAVHSMVTSTPCPHHEFVCSATNNLCVIRRKARDQSRAVAAVCWPSACLSCGLVVDYRGLKLIRGAAASPNQWAAAP